MPAIISPTRRERHVRAPADINAEYSARETSLYTLVNEFIDTTTPETFDDLYAQLVPELQKDVAGIARDNIRNFDAILEERRQRQVYRDGWLAFREWTRRQPWHAEALAAAEARAVELTAGDLETLREKYSAQGSALGQLRVERMRAGTDEARDAITEQIAELEREFAALNADD